MSINIATLRIQSDVPIPESRARSGTGLSAIFKQLKTGDSVFIPFQADQKVGSLSSQCHTGAKNANIRVTIRKFEECPLCGPACDIRPVEQNARPTNKEAAKHVPILGFRVWRVDDPDDVKKPGGPRVGGGQPKRKG